MAFESTWDGACEFSEYRFQKKYLKHLGIIVIKKKLNNEFLNSRTIYYYNVLDL